jgi:hypothetical protein
MTTPLPDPDFRDLLIYEFPKRQHSIKTKGYEHIGSSECPVTTEMYVESNNLKGSFNLMGVMAETWLAVLLDRVLDWRQ